ncbi:uncharacterized protein [Oscarella lobularis]|uniref:uncharacterized protein isoform X2 n=1 Tax=Oscarella lobularis TaxID=121494 RepID=UPI0033133FA8
MSRTNHTRDLQFDLTLERRETLPMQPATREPADDASAAEREVSPPNFAQPNSLVLPEDVCARKFDAHSADVETPVPMTEMDEASQDTKFVFTMTFDPRLCNLQYNLTLDVLQEETRCDEGVASLESSRTGAETSESLQATNVELERLQQTLAIESKAAAATKTKERVKRPKNGFILFCSAKRPELQKLHPGVDNRVISTLLGNLWRDMDEEAKQPYRAESERLREQHKRDHPDWKYNVDHVKRIKRKMKMIKKWKNSMEDERKRQQHQQESLHVQESHADEEDVVFEVDINEMEKSAEDFSDLPAAEPVMDESQCSSSDSSVVPLQQAFHIFDCSSFVEGSSATAPTAPDLYQSFDFCGQEELSLYPSTGRPGAELDQSLKSLASSSSSKPKRRRSTPYTFGCRRFYGLDARGKWCTGCRWKKKCCRNEEYGWASIGDEQ